MNKDNILKRALRYREEVITIENVFVVIVALLAYTAILFMFVAFPTLCMLRIFLVDGTPIGWVGAFSAWWVIISIIVYSQLSKYLQKYAHDIKPEG